ncbi:MAG: hypothetical protein CM1200mP29_17700 [Verrucomicrobiota bacterium]|nr:MAG: hypothetical protein CM1200mP29_17700 [Verrucomicrobiota bacterium]
MQNVLITAMLVTVSAGKDNALQLYELQPTRGNWCNSNILPAPPGHICHPDGSGYIFGAQRQQRGGLSH